MDQKSSATIFQLLDSDEQQISGCSPQRMEVFEVMGVAPPSSKAGGYVAASKEVIAQLRRVAWGALPDCTRGLKVFVWWFGVFLSDILDL